MALCTLRTKHAMATTQKLTPARLTGPFRPQPQEQAGWWPALRTMHSVSLSEAGPKCAAERCRIGNRAHCRERRTTRQNDDRRTPDPGAERHVGRARGKQARPAPGRFGYAANRRSEAGTSTRIIDMGVVSMSLQSRRVSPAIYSNPRTCERSKRSRHCWLIFEAARSARTTYR